MPDVKKCIIKAQGSTEVWASVSIHVHKCHSKDLPVGDEKGRCAPPWPARKLVSTNSHGACDANGPFSSWTSCPHTVLMRIASLSCKEIALTHLIQYCGGQELGKGDPGALHTPRLWLSSAILCVGVWSLSVQGKNNVKPTHVLL